MSELLGGLPPELCLHVGRSLPTCADIFAVAKTSRAHYQILHSIAYEHAASLPDGRGSKIVCWAAAKGLTRVIELAFKAGIDLNWKYRDETPGPLPRPWQLKNIQELAITKDDYCQDEDEDQEEERYSGLRRQYILQGSPLHFAAHAGHLEIVEQLLNYGANQHCSGCQMCECDRSPDFLGDFPVPTVQIHTYQLQWTPLHVALCNGHVSVAKTLLARNPTQPMTLHEDEPERVSTALHAACVAGKLDMVQWLIGSGHVTEVDAPDWRGHSPLIYARLYDRRDCVQYLLSLGADVNRIVFRIGRGRNEIRMNLLSNAIMKRRFSQALELLDVGSIKHDSALYCMSTTEWYVPENGAQPDKTARTQQLERGMQILRRLLSPLDPRERRDQLNDRLGNAAMDSNLTCVKALVHFGADVNIGFCDQSVIKAAPIIQVVSRTYGPQRQKFETVKWLLENGAKADVTSARGRTPLSIVCPDHPRQKMTDALQDIARILVEYGARPHRGTSGELTPGSLRENITGLSPLESVVRHTELFEAFLASCGLSALGDDDVLGVWEAATMVNSSDDFLMRILQFDAKNIIVTQVPDPVIDALRITPVPTNAVFELLERDARVSDYFNMLHVAVTNNASPDLVTALLDSTGGCEGHDRAKETVLARLLSTNGADEGSMAIAQAFLDDGVSAYALVSQRTAVGIAMSIPDDGKILDAIFEAQPLHERREEEQWMYIVEACEVGEPEVLRKTIASAAKTDSVIGEHAGNLCLLILQNVVHLKTVRQVLAVIDCLELLFTSSGGEAFDLFRLPAEFMDGMSIEQANRRLATRYSAVHEARELLAGLIHWSYKTSLRWHEFTTDEYLAEHGSGALHQVQALVWLFRSRIDFEKNPWENAQPVFKSVSFPGDDRLELMSSKLNGQLARAAVLQGLDLGFNQRLVDPGPAYDF